MPSSNDFFRSTETIPLSEVAYINASTVNPSKVYQWINYTDISSVGEHSVHLPITMPAQTAPSRARRKLQFGDIVISTVRPNRRSFFRFENQWANPICSTGFAVVSPKNGSDSEYLYALLTSHAATDFYESICEGGAYPAFNGAKLQDMYIPWHESRTRNSIGAIAADLRSKIEVNQQIASTLEQIAQTIFKSWFVDFDPVHAKARGEQPEGMDAETAALFPDSFEESELGPVPKAWKVSRIDEIANVMLGGTPSKSKPEYWDGDVAWINSGAVNEFRIIRPSAFITALGHEKSSTKLLRRGTTVLAITGATLGQFSRVEIPTTANQSVIGLEALDIDADEYMYLWISNYISELVSKATGGAQQHINRNDVCEHIMLMPSETILKKFASAVRPLFEQISSLLFQSETLSKLRDSLLPRLISGELEIPDEMLGA